MIQNITGSDTTETLAMEMNNETVQNYDIILQYLSALFMLANNNAKSFDHLLGRIEIISNESSRRFDKMDSRLEKMDSRLDNIDNSLEIIVQYLSEILGSTQTSRSAELIDECARHSVFYISYHNSTLADNNISINDSYHHCSAFAYQPDTSKDAVIVSAAHCFAAYSTGSSLTIMQLGDSMRHQCTILQKFLPPEDVSILDCPSLSRLTGMRSSTKTRLSQMVAITGFAIDSYQSSFDERINSHHLVPNNMNDHASF